MRKSGIDLIGDVSWGTHFCQFYQTQQDLADILVPYFREGLRQNEFCMWVTSEPLRGQDAREALRQAVPELDDYLRRGQIEILDYTQWYTVSGEFEAERVLRGWADKEQAALARGFDGLRLTGNTFWLEQKDWQDFTRYEAMVNEVIGKHRMIALCTYCLDRCGPLELLDVVGNHQFALIKQAGQWRIIESSQHRQREAQERTADLAKAVEALENEARRRQAAQALAEERARLLEAFFRHSLNPLVFLDRQFNFLRVNEAYARGCGRDVAEFPGHNHFEFYPHAENEAIFREVVRTKRPYQAFAKPFVFPDHPEWGTTFWDWTLTPILDAAGEVEFLVFSLQDVTERKRAEQRDRCTGALLELFAKKAFRKEYLGAVLDVIRGWSDCRCLGIRVVDRQRNIPYETYVGFSPEFWQQENWLSLQHDTCACTRVILGAPEPQDAAVMTPGGSFRCDNAIAFVKGLSPRQQARYRGICVRSGFASLAVIPIRYRGEALGAIHLADEREGMVPLASIE
jgi:PAS domain S-box-containing protein